MIPNKSTFKFQELTPITGVKPYVIRFWETEFEEIAPITSDSGQKLYARKDIEVIIKIRNLLFDDKMSIPAAKLALKASFDEAQAVSVTAETTQVEEVSVPVVSHGNLELVAQAISASLELVREVRMRRGW